MPTKQTVLLLALLIAGVASAHDHTRPAAKPIHLVAAQAAPNAVACSIQIIDEATGNDLPVCIRVRPKNTDNDSWLPLPSLLSRVTGLSNEKAKRGWNVLPHGHAEVTLPKGMLLIEAISGLNTPPRRRSRLTRGRFRSD